MFKNGPNSFQSLLHQHCIIICTPSHFTSLSAPFNSTASSIHHFNPTPHFPYVSSLCILKVPVVVMSVSRGWALLPNCPPASSLSLHQPSLPLSCLSVSANPGCAELLPAGSERSPAGTLLSHPPAGTRLHFQPSTACLGFIMCVCAAAPPAEAGRGGGRLVARVRTKKKQGDRG